MRIVILPSALDVALFAADAVVEAIQANPRYVLGLATGSTPVSLYQELVRRYAANEVSFAEVTSFNLDEYIGISAAHPQSYRAFMNRHLFDRINIDHANTFVPMAEADQQQALASSAEQYEATIRAKGGIDLQILGLGENGHIGFNEPMSSLSSRTRIKTLSESTIEANKRFFSADEFQPYLALTMGIGTILDSKNIILLATGQNKAAAVQAMIEGPLAAMVPASALQLHKQTTIVIDQDAASALRLGDYYKWSEQQRRQLNKGQQDA